MASRAPGRIGGRRYRNTSPWVYVLFLPPFVALLYPPFYARTEPSLGGVPFFIWYQFAWVIITSLLTAAVFKLRTGLPFFGRETGTAIDDMTAESSDEAEGPGAAGTAREQAGPGATGPEGGPGTAGTEGEPGTRRPEEGGRP